MAYPYITQAELESRVSADVLQQVLDDNNDGEADADPVATVIADASSKVASYLRQVYDLEVVASVRPREVVRLTLDVAVAYLAQRHPEYVRRDWVTLMQAAERDLKRLRDQDTRLDITGSPEPAATDGGFVSVVKPNDSAPDRVFDDMGDF